MYKTVSFFQEAYHQVRRPKNRLINNCSTECSWRCACVNLAERMWVNSFFLLFELRGGLTWPWKMNVFVKEDSILEKGKVVHKDIRAWSGILPVHSSQCCQGDDLEGIALLSLLALLHQGGFWASEAAPSHLLRLLISCALYCVRLKYSDRNCTAGPCIQCCHSLLHLILSFSFGLTLPHPLGFNWERCLSAEPSLILSGLNGLLLCGPIALLAPPTLLPFYI